MWMFDMIFSWQFWAGMVGGWVMLGVLDYYPGKPEPFTPSTPEEIYRQRNQPPM